jgi:hypothetical protein
MQRSTLKPILDIIQDDVREERGVGSHEAVAAISRQEADTWTAAVESGAAATLGIRLGKSAADVGARRMLVRGGREIAVARLLKKIF